MVALTLNPSIQEAKADISLQIQGYPTLYRIPSHTQKDPISKAKQKILKQAYKVLLLFHQVSQCV